MTTRKEKEKDFFVQHMETFKKLGVIDPEFLIKTAFFQKGKFGRQVQFIESELKKERDLYVEFYENVEVNGIKDVVPMSEDRQLFRYKYNPYFHEEYELKENVNSKGEPYSSYIVPVSELTAILPNGNEVTYSVYEKMKSEKELEMPRLQNKVTPFPDFEEEFAPKKEQSVDLDDLTESASDILLRIANDFQKLAQKLK